MDHTTSISEGCFNYYPLMDPVPFLFVVEQQSKFDRRRGSSKVFLTFSFMQTFLGGRKENVIDLDSGLVKNNVKERTSFMFLEPFSALQK